MRSHDSLGFKTFVPRNKQNLCPISHRARRLKPHVVIRPSAIVEENQNIGVNTQG